MIGTGDIKIHIGMEDGGHSREQSEAHGKAESSPGGEFSVHLLADHGIPEQLLCLDEAILGPKTGS